jgi:hypothetical protein
MYALSALSSSANQSRAIALAALELDELDVPRVDV